MAKQRVVNTYFWNDPFIMKLRAEEKLLFLYALTNPQTDLCGAYELAMEKMVLETRLTERKILDIFAKFESEGKICYRRGWVFIRNFAKHQQGNSPNVKKGAIRSLSLCPDWVKQTLTIGFETPSIENALLPIGITSRENLTEQPKPIPVPVGLEPQAARPKTKTPESGKPKPEAPHVLPEDFTVTDAMRKWATENAPLIPILSTTEEFIEYWHDIRIKDNKRTSRGWVATWKSRFRYLTKQIKENQNGTNQPNNRGNYNQRPSPGETIANREYYRDHSD